MEKIRYFSMHMLYTVQNLVAKFNPRDCSYKLKQTLRLIVMIHVVNCILLFDVANN